MKKYSIGLAFLAFGFLYGTAVKADMFSAWADEDEEAVMSPDPSSTASRQPSSVRQQSRPSSGESSGIFSAWEEEDEEYNIKGESSLSRPERDSKSKPQNSAPVSAAPVPAANITVLNDYPQDMVPISVSQSAGSGILDYDMMQTEHAIGAGEIANSIGKWERGTKNTYWENYRGNNVRVEVLRNNRDFKEMRLKFVQSQDMVSDPDASISDMLNVVADKVMKSTCGRKARQAIILYERPSVELVKETAYDNYKILAKGNSIKEYGFRCIY